MFEESKSVQTNVVVKAEKCQWCQEEAVALLEIKPARYKVNGYGKRALIKPAFTVPVCKHHSSIIEHQAKHYTCGCTYVEGEDTCSFHGRKQKFVRTKLTDLPK